MDFDKLYHQRQTYGKLCEEMYSKYGEEIYGNGELFWDYCGGGTPGGDDPEYFEFTSLDDLIDQFNFVGFHDVCNYISMQQISEMHLFGSSNRKKEFDFLLPGYNDRNSSGPSYIPSKMRVIP